MNTVALCSPLLGSYILISAPRSVIYVLLFDLLSSTVSLPPFLLHRFTSLLPPPLPTSSPSRYRPSAIQGINADFVAPVLWLSQSTFLVFFAVFELGSLLCGVAVSSDMLIVSRAVAGLGSAGLMNGALTIIAACVPLRRRPCASLCLVSSSKSKYRRSPGQRLTCETFIIVLLGILFSGKLLLDRRLRC